MILTIWSQRSPSSPPLPMFREAARQMVTRRVANLPLSVNLSLHLHGCVFCEASSANFRAA